MPSSSDRLLGGARRTARAVLLSAFAVSAGINLLMLTGPLYMLQVYDRVIAARHLDTLLYLTLMAAAALAVYGVLEGVRSVVGIRLGAWLERRLAAPVVAATAGIAQASGGGRGVPALRDLANVRGMLAGGALWPVLDAPWSLLFYGVVFLIHPWLGWCAVAGGLLLLAVAGANELASRRQLKAAGQKSAGALGEADAAIRNADAMLAMGLLPSFLRRWSAASDGALAHLLCAGHRSALLGAVAKAVRLGLQVATLGLGAYLAVRAELSPGAMVAASIIVARAVAPLEQSIVAWRSIVTGQAAWSRVCQLLNAAGNGPERMRLPRPAGRLTVERASFGAGPGTAPIVRQASFALEPGQALAILGPSGAGKTTLLRLLVGSLVPLAGQVRLDGGAVAEWAEADKQRHIGYLPQDVELFNASVRDNIARFTDASDEEVVQAAQLAGAHEMILRLPQGYATIVGPGGVALSGGQRQRIGLARALFGDPRLVVLDEPNAHLDAEGEQALQAAMRALKERAVTVVLVAQRLSVLALVDLVLKLRDGRVEAFGPRDAVLAAADERGRVLRVPANRMVAAGARAAAGGE
ncbi:type I secretion system permease/ATPase [Desertibaculum subflavum]|uniref:type I secretion system permease/ATPase n=1 Tax=Desertibaculum subflavum TaxID=2268458 RepID=UPI000E66D0B6